jgi:DNA gyrase/topoisomerase IV subunit A
VVITISHAGYIKRNLSNTKLKIEGSRAKKSAGRDQDFLEHMFVATNHQYMMFFTQKENVLDACMKFRKEVKQQRGHSKSYQYRK